MLFRSEKFFKVPLRYCIDQCGVGAVPFVHGRNFERGKVDVFPMLLQNGVTFKIYLFYRKIFNPPVYLIAVLCLDCAYVKRVVEYGIPPLCFLFAVKICCVADKERPFAVQIPDCIIFYGVGVSLSVRCVLAHRRQPCSRQSVR